MKRTRNKQGRCLTHWCFTSYLNTKSFLYFNEEHVSYIIWQYEMCPKTSRLHWQGYVELKRAQYRSYLKNEVFNDDTLHADPRKGSRVQARHYCMKPVEGCDCDKCKEERANPTKIDGPWEYGEWHEGSQGRRSDIIAFKEALDSNMPVAEIADKHFLCWLKYGKLIQNYRLLRIMDSLEGSYAIDKFNIPPLDLQKCHYHLWGDPDLGKTQYALAHFRHPLHVKHIDWLAKFDPNYHDGVVFSEMTFFHIPPQQVINLLNRKDPVQFHVRYMVAYIPIGIPMIFTTNEEDIFYQDNAAHYKYYWELSNEVKKSINTKCLRIHVVNKLFD